jgi:hypothetical protein
MIEVPQDAASGAAEIENIQIRWSDPKFGNNRQYLIMIVVPHFQVGRIICRVAHSHRHRW